MGIDRKKIIDEIDSQYERYADYYKAPYIEAKFLEGLTFGQLKPQAREAASRTEKILGTAAEFAGMMPGFGVASKIARYGTKLAGLTGAAARIATEAGVGGIIGAVEPAEDERERVAHVLENAAIFGAFGAGAEGLRRIVRKIRGVKDIKTPLADDEIGEIVDEVTRSGDAMERFSSLLPVPIKQRFDYWARQRRVMQLGPRPQRVIGEDILAGEAGVRQRFGEGLFLPGAAEWKALPESLSKTLAGGKGVMVRLPGSLKRTEIQAGDVVQNIKTKAKHVVKNVGEVIGISEPGTRGTKQIPVRDFRRDYVFAGRPEDVRGRVGERETLRAEMEAMPRVSREVTERMPPKDLGPIEEADRFKKWKRKIGKEQLSRSAVELSGKEKTFFEIELDNLRKGKVEKGGLIRDAEGAVAGRYGSVSTNPDWFRKDIAGSWDKREVVSMMDKAIGGQALTPRQKQMFEDVREAVNRHHTYKPFTGQFAVSPVGFVAGVEKDEEGKWTLNPSKAMAGALGTLALGMVAGKYAGELSKKFKAFVNKEGHLILEDLEKIPKSVWSKYNKIRKAKGYDVRGADDVKALFERFNKKGDKYVIQLKDQVDDLVEAMGIGLSDKALIDRKFADAAKKQFGITSNFKEAGYLTKDGKLLDFSGKREGGAAGVRSYDHRQIRYATDNVKNLDNEIFKVYPNKEENFMFKFMAGGNIRMLPESGGVDMMAEPTIEQYGKLRKYFRDWNGENIVEAINGNKRFYNEYNAGTGADRIINDIKNFYKGLEKRKSLVSEFHSGVGGLAGFEVDEEGNVSYDPTKGLLGLAGGVVVGKAIGAEGAKRLIDKIARLGKEGQNFIRKTFDLKFHRLAEMDQAKAKALDEVVSGMLKRAEGVGRTAERVAAKGVKAGERAFLGRLKELIDSRGTDAFRRAMKAANLTGKNLDDLTAKEAEKVEKVLAGFPELAKGIKESAKIEAERGSVRGFFKEKFEKARKWMDAAIDTAFDEANLRRYGETAWNKGQHGIFAREMDAKITEDVARELKRTSPRTPLQRGGLKQATADFKAAVTLNMERDMFGIAEWNNIFNEAVNKVQDPVTKNFLKRVKGIIDEGSPMLKEYTNLFKEDFARYKEILADEGLKKEFVEDYVTHLWNMEGESLASSRMALKTQFQYAKERLMPSYIQGIAKGLKPLGLDVVYINEHYKKALETVLANRRFVQHLQGLSVEMPNMDKFKMVIDSKTFEALAGIDQRMYTTVNHRAFAGKYVHGNVAKDLRNIFETSKWRDIWYGKKYLKINQYMKRMKLAASGFHHVALGFNNLFYHGDKWWKLGNPLPFDLFNWKSGYKKGMEAYFKKNPILEFGVRNGLTLDETGAMADYYHKFKRNMLSWPEQKGALGEMKQMARDFIGLWDDALWGKFFVGSKAFAFMTEYGRNLKFLEKKFPKLYEEWKAKGFAKTFETAFEKKAAQFAARDVNDLYGGLNYELLKISQTTQDTLRAFVLAPDWQTSNWRSFLNGVRNLGTGGASKTTVAAGKRLAQVVITLGGLGNMINYVTTGRFVWDNPAGYKGMVAIGEVDGKPYYMDFYRHFGEFLKVFKYGNDKKISTYIYDSPIRYLVNKTSQIMRVFDSLRTGEDWRGRPLADWKALMSGKMWQSKYIPWWERGSVLPGVILQIGEAFVPIPGQQVQRSIIGDEPWIVGGTSLFGVHVKEYRGNQARWKPKTRRGIRKISAVGKIRGVD